MADGLIDFGAMLFGGDQTATPVVDPVQRPDAVARPGFGGGMAPSRRERLPAPMQPPVQPPMPQQAPQFRDFGQELFKTAPNVERPAPQPPAQPGGVQPEPDAPTWVGRRIQDLAGRHDPRFRDLPAISEVLNKEGSTTFGTAGQEMWGWLTGAKDEEMARVFKGILGKRFMGVQKDANGYPIIAYRDKDGKPAAAYVNKPGLDAQDLMRGAVGIAPYVGAARAINYAGKGAKLAGRVVSQALGQAGTAVVQDVAGNVLGPRDLDVNETYNKAKWAAAGGAGGEIVGAGLGLLWRKLIAEPRYYNRATQALTPEGEAAARAGGLDPEHLMAARGAAQDFGMAMAKTGDPQQAVSHVVNREFRIPKTSGELSGNPDQLLREQQMTGGSYGQRVSADMQTFRKGQDAAIDNAVRGEVAPGVPGIGPEIAPSRAGQAMTKGEVGANIRANTEGALARAKSIEKKAWRDVPEMHATPETLAELPGHIATRVEGILISEKSTPAAAEMAQALSKFRKGEAPAAVSDILPKPATGNINQFRKDLYLMMKGAATPEDKRAAGALYDAYNDWIVKAATMSGDPTAAARLIVARGVTRRLRETFDGVRGSPGARIMGDILEKADSPEGIVDALFINPASSNIKRGSLDALKSLKKAYEEYYWPRGSQEMKAAWDDIRLAYWLKLTERKTGELTGPAQLSTNIKTAMNSQKSVFDFLYEAPERARMLRLAKELDQVKKKNPNSSWSGIAIGNLLKDASDAVISMLGANSIIGRMAIRAASSPVRDAYGAALQRSATGGGAGASVPTRPLPSFAGPGAGAAIYDNSLRQRGQ